MRFDRFISRRLAYFRRVKYSLTQDFKRSSIGKHPQISAVICIFLLTTIIVINVKSCQNKLEKEAQESGYEAAIRNYSRDIKILAHQFDMPQEFLMALIMLESSGRKDVPSRFEPAVYQKLKDIQEHKSAMLEGISINDIGDANDEALRNLASSWGPFQLMGYKCLHLNIKIKELRGNNSLYWGVYWIDKTYGTYVRKGRYQDAFHIHNTGHPVPKNGKFETYDPNYIPNGLKYMEFFKQNM